MDSVWKTFRAAKLGTSAAWALGVTSLAAVLGQGVAQAAVVTCPTSPITTAGGNSPGTAPDVSGVCDGTQIIGNQSFPSYWEFTWADASGNSTIDADIISTGLDGGSFSGNLKLLDSNSNVLQSASFFLPGSIGSSADPSITYNMTNGSTYFIGLTDTTSDPSFTVTFAAAPEPASLGIFGGALAALAAFRRRRKHFR